MITPSFRHRLGGFGDRLTPAALGLNPKAPDQGLTLIECLVAIVMVALVSGAIAPTMVLSVATRVHSQKSEQALALAQSEIDRVRVAVERGGYTVAQLPPVAVGVGDRNVAAVPAPTNLNAANGNNVANAVGVDVTGDGTNDFLVQRYRTAGQDANGVPVAFAMGVRVYDINAAGTLTTAPASLVMTSNENGRRTRPLAVLHTTIATSDQGDSLCNLSTYLNGGAAPANLPPVCAAPAAAPAPAPPTP
ncbi:prepilin-type N-terminal cleavage/methylation domain-containing protein [Nodosilinea sp. E11]|uniref:prepilin-type N-terminal cleavage/methylation domain-containing protein n=1 Tax=Nodosilinea sp. E11 TaxID=3037479 RepID=UPI0029346167|nr:prepilin-type N-terminal cleavage/methylation domain-containing protein [Nodosilinea sp. E11]WOD38702.1 prepilin-type N-terminal cleavage/methylation domain-containing protein [Nodosilinea sp. E11]